MRPYSHALEQLRTVGLRPTRQRLALAKLLFEGGDRHVTAEMLHAEALGSAIRVSLATVYNTLHQFTGAGLLREIVVDSSRSYFDTNNGMHHHYYFEKSGKLEDIPDDMIDVVGLPGIPQGTRLQRIDVVVRLEEA
ncbi:iron response transcriptional regulator IrrA [Varunaivibrio sulfuroxidans]|uniref:Ferric uptake regulation protein n=1 Tax=Varunaivibrio sulfuroxidans TaxID=1773489 RepID=A0A4R3JHS0_9PROT|nr:Fur family transcriptional regulator [Varunaivibrio sulfuroxidans]TCS65065.1 Fur family iron response transcriptional regulator [Varunaivibrio sulfuroxidans]WES29648.1 Fur family transcriptional regulator [Varunaivibrio sulfuroxidans]